MAGNRIKGITVEIGGDTQGLDKALKGVNDTSRDLQKELRDVQRLLKFDPNNAELMAQRQELLNQQVENTKDKLQQLQSVQAQVEAQFQAGDLGVEQYRAFQRELQDTQSYLRNTQNAIADLEQEQQQVGRATRELNLIFEATGNSLQDYENVLGTRLVRAIQQGTASSRDLDRAFDLVGQSAIGSGQDIDQIRQAIRQVDQGTSSIQDVRQEIQRLGEDAQESQGSVRELGGELTSMVAGAGAGLGIGKIFEEAMDLSNLDTTIELTMDIPEESIQSVKNAVSVVGGYIGDNEQALEGVRKQFQLNADLTDAQNQKIVEGAGTIANAYKTIDFTELIQESYEMGKSLNMSQEDALGMTKALLDMGFPPEQLDIITEYGAQLSRAGYTAEEIQGIFASGIETGSWNIDNLLDGIKEGRIQLATFGAEVPKAVKESLKGTDISAKQVQAWGNSMAKGGEQGKQAMMDVAIALSKVEDDTQRNTLGTQLFGTMWEDQGSKITDTIINANKNMGDLDANTNQLAEDNKKLDASPQQQLNQALSSLQTTFAPLLLSVAEFIGKVAEWMSQNPTLVASIVGIVSVIGILMGIFMALAPVVTMITTLAGFLGVTIGAVTLPILAVIAVIGTLIAIGILLYKNWDEIKARAVSDWNELKEIVLGAVKKIRDKFNTDLNDFVNMWKRMGQNIRDKFNSDIEDVKRIGRKISEFFKGIDLTKIGKDIIQGLINGIGSMADKVKRKAEDIANGIGSKIKSILKLGSPSKVMIGMGQDTGEGLAIGLADKIRRVQEVSQSLAKSVTNSVKSVVDTNANTFTGLDRVLYDYFEAIQEDGDWANDWLTHMPKKLHDIAMQFGRNNYINMEGRDKASISEAVKTVKNLNVTLNSPKAFDIRMASREFNKTLNKMSLQW